MSRGQNIKIVLEEKSMFHLQLFERRGVKWIKFMK